MKNTGIQNVDVAYSSLIFNKRLVVKTEKVLRRLNNIKNVLVVGCGEGTFTADLKERLPHINFTGSDSSVLAIDTALKTYKDCNFLVADILKADTLPPLKYDLVIIQGLIQHYGEWPDIIIKNALLLSDNIVIAEHNHKRLIGARLRKKIDYTPPKGSRFLSQSDLDQICSNHNLQITHLSFFGFVPFAFSVLPSKVIQFLQPLLEGFPLLPELFAAYVIIHLKKKPGRSSLGHNFIEFKIEYL